MLEDEQGRLYCTSQALCEALGLEPSALNALYHSNKEEFDGNCVNRNDAISTLKENRLEFGYKYIRGDMHLWSEDDMLLVAIRSRSSGSREFRKYLLEFVKKNAWRGWFVRVRRPRRGVGAAALRRGLGPAALRGLQAVK
jgi:prophage antirepressor-like protein